VGGWDSRGSGLEREISHITIPAKWPGQSPRPANTERTRKIVTAHERRPTSHLVITTPKSQQRARLGKEYVTYTACKWVSPSMQQRSGKPSLTQSTSIVAPTTLALPAARKPPFYAVNKTRVPRLPFPTTQPVEIVIVISQ
jgi:hypothetical protein